MFIKRTKLVPKYRKNNQPLFEEFDIINMIFTLQYPPKVHLSRDVYSNSFKSGWSHFRKNLKSKNLKIQKFKISKIQKFENSKIQKNKNSKIRKSENPSSRRALDNAVATNVR